MAPPGRGVKQKASFLVHSPFISKHGAVLTTTVTENIWPDFWLPVATLSQVSRSNILLSSRTGHADPSNVGEGDECLKGLAVVRLVEIVFVINCHRLSTVG